MKIEEVIIVLEHRLNLGIEGNVYFAERLALQKAIESLRKCEIYRDFIEKIAGGVYDSPMITHDEIRSDAIEILSKELK